MMQELFIDGQRVDLSDDSITLEFVSGLFSDVGKISLSRSYTIRLPRSKRNTRILDDPGSPAHASSKTRRYLNARYYRNGVDLLGDAFAYVLQSTPDSYEIGLLWNTMPKLLAWREANRKLTDLEGLGYMHWVNSQGVPDYQSGSDYVPAFFAKYTSGLGSLKYPAVNAAPHPVVTVFELLGKTMSEAGISWTASPMVVDALRNTAVLAPGHKPSRAMEISSGASARVLEKKGDAWVFSVWEQGWDSPYKQVGDSYEFQKGTADSIRIILSLRVHQGAPDIYIEVSRANQKVVLVPERTDDGGYLMDDIVSMSDIGVDEETENFEIAILMESASQSQFYTIYEEDMPMFAVIRHHESIPIANDNRFPIADNLPDMGQVEFVKGICALFGLSPHVQSGQLVLRSYAEAFDITDALDWTAKLDMENREAFETLSYAQDGFAKRNLIKYTEDVPLISDPTISILIDDETLKSEAELYKLPFAGSNGDQVIHYKTSWNESDSVWDLEDVGIKPRILGWETDDTGVRHLTFVQRLQGRSALDSYYSDYQKVLRAPVRIEALIRLTELDLKTLDFYRTVYLGQFGRYYAVLKVQTSATDTCKVELLQIA